MIWTKVLDIIFKHFGKIFFFAVMLSVLCVFVGWKRILEIKQETINENKCLQSDDCVKRARTCMKKKYDSAVLCLRLEGGR